MTHHRGHTRAQVIVLTSLLILSLAQPHARAQQPNRVGLIVDFGNGVVSTRCVEFSEPEITGYEVLSRSGLGIVADEATGMGVAICDIGATSGCPASNCFCKCQGNDCTYWTYYRWEGGAWQYSGLGASSSTAQHGDVEGWVWGEGSPGQGSLPPVISYDEICAATSGVTAATETAPAREEVPATPTTLPPTDTPLPSPSPTAETATPPPVRESLTPTVRPTVEPTATASSPPTPVTEPTSVPSSTSEVQASNTPVQENPPSGEEGEPLAVPTGYAVFGLVVVGLIGWLIHTSRSRGPRA